MLSMLSLQPYEAAVPSRRIQCSSRLRRKGGTQVRFACGMINLLENTGFLREDRMVWKIKVFV